MTHEQPITNPHIGCLCCGGGEMKKDEEVILCDMDTRLYNGFGGWSIRRNTSHCFEANAAKDIEWEEYPTLKDIETLAKHEPNEDWKAYLDLPLRGAVYQRQGNDRWVLISTNMGFA